MSSEYSEGWQSEIFPPLSLFLPIFLCFMLLIKTMLSWHVNKPQNELHYAATAEEFSCLQYNFTAFHNNFKNKVHAAICN